VRLLHGDQGSPGIGGQNSPGMFGDILGPGLIGDQSSPGISDKLLTALQPAV
jgi:hypothetical protein